MSNNTLNSALRRLGYSKEEVSVSGFRATASTLFGTTWSLPMLYAVILIVLLIRPQGLLGRPMEARL